jgi:hypothetical protein
MPPTNPKDSVLRRYFRVIDLISPSNPPRKLLTKSNFVLMTGFFSPACSPYPLLTAIKKSRIAPSPPIPMPKAPQEIASVDDGEIGGELLDSTVHDDS